MGTSSYGNGCVLGIDPGRYTGWAIMRIGACQDPRRCLIRSGQIKSRDDEGLRLQLRDMCLIARTEDCRALYIEDQSLWTAPAFYTAHPVTNTRGLPYRP